MFIILQPLGGASAPSFHRETYLKAPLLVFKIRVQVLNPTFLKETEALSGLCLGHIQVNMQKCHYMLTEKSQLWDREVTTPIREKQKTNKNIILGQHGTQGKDH